jgi:SAM-dependent methyltransferase
MSGVAFDPGSSDAWGRALLDQLDQRDVAQPLLELDSGDVVPAMHPDWFFRPFEAWDWWEPELLSAVIEGPVLDLGCGAGRVALHLQQLGFAVTAVDNSPGAVEVCRRRGVVDVRLGDLNDPPDDHRWGAVLLLCGNLGLGGSWECNRTLLRRLSDLAAPNAVLVGDSVNFRGEGDLRLRIRYGGAVTPWWRQRNVKATEVPALVDGTGWRVERQFEDGDDHAVILRRSANRRGGTESA